MINPQHVFNFCTDLRTRYGAGFIQNPMPNGFKVMGEYYTYSGQVLTIALTVSSEKVEIKIYDSSKRLIFSNLSKENINMNERVINFIQKSVTAY